MKQPVPGPKYSLPPLVGLNQHDPRRERAPGYSFGNRFSYNAKSGPGPYYINGDISNRGKNYHNGFSLAGRPRNPLWEKRRLEDQPHTNLDINRASVEPCSPRYSFGGARKTSHKTEGPGPIYNLPSTIGQAPGARLFGRNPRLSFHFDQAKSPGPVYNTAAKDSTNSGVGVTLGQRTRLPGNKTITPGPIYNPSWNGPCKNSPRYSMGIRHHPEVVPLADVTD